MCRFVTGVAVLTAALLLASTAQPCSRILWNDNGQAVLVGRNSDWPGTSENPGSTRPTLEVFPRSIARDGSTLAGQVVVKDNSVKWTSKYGSVVTSGFGIGSCDGMNEKGLGVHLQYLEATDFGKRDVRVPGLQAALWGQYLLDNAATVKEALALHDNIQIVMIQVGKVRSAAHIAIEDATGDSAIIEYISGKPVIHHGKEFCVMTNDPAYDEQLKMLSQQHSSPPGNHVRLPGKEQPTVDRLLRATYYVSVLPRPKSEREAVASILAVTRSLSVPFGAPFGSGTHNTEYRTVLDLTHRRYYFELTTNLGLIWVDLSRINFEPAAPVLSLDPAKINFAGDVTDKFQKQDQAPY